RLEEASYSLGASRARTFWRVTLPQLYPAMAAALVIAFTRIITELGTTLVVYQPGWTTISMQIFSYAQEGLVNRAGAISMILIAGVDARTELASYNHQRRSRDRRKVGTADKDLSRRSQGVRKSHRRCGAGCVPGNPGHVGLRQDDHTAHRSRVGNAHL